MIASFLIAAALQSAPLHHAAPLPPPDAPRTAQDARDRDAVLAAVHAFLAASNARDSKAAAKLIVPDGRATGVGCGPEGKYDSIFAESLAKTAEEVTLYPENGEEELIDPRIRIDGNLALVWGDYVYRQGGDRNQSGIVDFQLIRTPAGWKILNYTWSTQKADCGKDAVIDAPAAARDGSR